MQYNFNKLFMVGKSVEEITSEYDDFDGELKFVIITDTDSKQTFTFDEEDIDYIGENLLNRSVKSYEVKLMEGSVGLLIEI